MILITERYASVTIQVIRYCWEPFFYSFRARKKNRERAAARTNCTEKNFARNEKVFYLKEKTTANMGQKRGESLLSSGSLLFTIQIYNIFRQKANRINI